MKSWNRVYLVRRAFLIAAVASAQLMLAQTQTCPQATKVQADIVTPSTGVYNPDAVAVVVGICDYEDSDLPKVKYAINDAVSVRRLLVKTLGYDDKRIFSLFDRSATWSRLHATIKIELARLVVREKSDVFV